jgi:hypothetical protein
LTAFTGMGSLRVMRARIVAAVLALCGPGLGCQSKSAPKGPTCAQVADHVMKLFGAEPDDHAREVRDVFLARCTADEWPEAVRSCIRATVSLLEPRNCKQMLSAAQAKSLDKELAAADDRVASRTIPASCVRYESVLALAEKCESFPASGRKELRERFDAFKATWPSVKDKRALDPTCSSAIASVKLAAAGCPGVAKW